VATTKRRGSSKSSLKKKRTPVRQHLAPWARDALGVGLVVAALLAVLALWFDAAGPAGGVIEYVLHGTIGSAAVIFPFLGFYWGVLLLRGTAEDDRVRMFIGFAIAVVGILGLHSIVNGNPSPASGYSGIRDAAGMLGAIAAWPLSNVVSAIGAGIVCAGLAFLGILIFSGTPLATVWERLGELREELAERQDARIAREEEREKEAMRRRAVRDEEEEGPTVVLPELFDEEEPEEEEELEIPPRLVRAAEAEQPEEYELPPLSLLRKAPSSSADGRDEEHTMEALERTFVNFGVPARVPTAHRGPTVTLYEVEVEAGTKVHKVLSLADDIAYALATPDVRIIAPIPGRSAIGVEVPNKVRDFVTLGDVLRSRSAKEAADPLSVGLGKDVHGRTVMVNLSDMPHLLIAGATGAGKSSLINAFVTSILMRTTPEEVKLVLVDPKRVELSHFADLPHLLSPVIVHPKRAAEALEWVVREMELRYEILATVGVRDLDGYHEGLEERVDRAGGGPPPSLAHLLDRVHDLRPVLRGAGQDGNDPHPQPAAPVHAPHGVPRIDYPISD